MARTGREPDGASLPSRTAPVRFATFTLDLDGCSLSRADGGDVALTHNEFALLRVLVRHPGRALSRDYLLDALVGKRAGPFDRGVDVLVGRLRRKIEADPKKPRLIVTVPGEGYRFDGLTKTFQSAPTGRPRTRRPAPVEPRNVVEGAGKPVDDAVGATARLEPPAAPRLSLVVLPFANIGGDASQDYFVDGVTDSLTADLSRISGSVVMARNMVFGYKGNPVDPRAIGRELNIRYVLAGSVQREAARMRVNVQLIDAESGAHLWVERFEKPIAGLFEMQDEIVARLANSLNTRLVTTEARRGERAPNPDAMDLYFQGMAWRNPPFERLWRSTQTSPSRASERARRATIRDILLHVSVYATACARPGFPRAERSSMPTRECLSTIHIYPMTQYNRPSSRRTRQPNDRDVGRPGGSRLKARACAGWRAIANAVNESASTDFLTFRKKQSNYLGSRKMVHSAMAASIAGPIFTRTLTAAEQPRARQLHILHMISPPLCHPREPGCVKTQAWVCLRFSPFPQRGDIARLSLHAGQALRALIRRSGPRI